MSESESESEQAMDSDRKVEILKALRKDPLFGLVSINPDKPDGVLIYDRPVSRAGGVPAMEIPHEDPFLIDESRQRNPQTGQMENVPGVSPPEKSFDELLAEYGCIKKQRGDYTYVVVVEGLGSKRPPKTEE